MAGKEEALRMSDKEQRLIALLRGIQYGEVKIVIQDGVPIRIEEIKKSIKL